ncbi:MAG TPA: HAMP domain-containing sensor histidine kinase [Mycobacteriales bacterium]|nr:HAMP domain-containing sensor histidine kinase [Mycobacteriales bacterium]
MASAPGFRKRLAPSGWSLRARLLAALIGLLIAVCIVIGTVTTLVLKNFLYDQLDDQLQAATTRSTGGFDHHAPPTGSDPLGWLLAPGQTVGTFGARLDGGSVVAAGVLDRDAASVTPVSSSAYAAIRAIAQDGKPHTVSISGYGDYRVLARRMPFGGTIVTGLPLNTALDTVYRLAGVEICVAAAGVIAAGVLGSVIIRLTLRPLHRVAATASRVSELPLHRGEVALPDRVPEGDIDPRTEVGQVGAALNRMLGHVAGALSARHESEMQVRQFVADASHELRTPLSSIRGYAELTRRSTGPVPPDIRYALDRVEAEATRMTGLVEDLLLLARLDAGRPLEQSRVDLSALVVDVVSDAHAAGSDHRWELELSGEALTVIGDEARLHQVLVNLLANARTHTPPGTTVVTDIRARGDHLQIRVTDDGPGIPPDILPHVFERFARGDTSRARTAGSTGLGLAIVDAVVAAHHGTVRVDSVPGRTRFTVRLPWQRSSQPLHSSST